MFLEVERRVDKWIFKGCFKKYLCLWTIAARADASGECFAFTVNALSSRARKSVHLKKSEWDIKWAFRRGSEKRCKIPLQRCFCHSSRQHKELPAYTCHWSRHHRDRWCRSSVVELRKDKAIDTNLSTTKIRIESHVQKKRRMIPWGRSRSGRMGWFPCKTRFRCRDSYCTGSLWDAACLSWDRSRRLPCKSAERTASLTPPEPVCWLSFFLRLLGQESGILFFFYYFLEKYFSKSSEGVASSVKIWIFLFECNVTLKEQKRKNCQSTKNMFSIK